ncbi:MAG: DUF2207 domain-containing protein [Nitriliruptoraceae bacterium]|nr:DUF2207 domain-containing protein [Nitriliruptoraceae bacterium]
MMFQRRVRVRRLRFALAALAGLTLIGTGVLGAVATSLEWDGLLTPGPGWDDRYTIRSYDVAGTLAADGTYSVTEDITVEWHEPRRGLIRDIDRSAPDGREMTVRDIEVTSDTQDDVWFEVLDDTDGVDSVHLGEEVEYRPLGVDHYRISYELDGLLVASDGIATLRWDTFGDQWDTLIEQVSVTLELPDGDHDLACVVGAVGEAFACEGTGPDWTAESMRPGRGVTVEARLDPAAVDPAGAPAADLGPLEEFDRVALQRLGLIAGLTAGATLPLLGTVGGPATRRRRRQAAQRIETTGVTYAPPRGLSPLTGGFLVRGEHTTTNDGELFAAWLLDTQQRGLIDVRSRPKEREGDTTDADGDGDGFAVRLTGRGTPSSEEEGAALRSLVPTGEQWSTWDDDTPDKQRTAFETDWQALKKHHAEEAGVPGSVTLRIGPAGMAMGVAAVALAVVLAQFAPGGLIAVILGLIAAWAASAYTDHTLRTAIAYLPDDRIEPWRQLEGLRRFVSEAHAEQISGLADDPNVALDDPFLQLLPWVIAFGYGEQWAERFDQNIRAATEQHGYYAPVRTTQITAARSVATPQASTAGGGGASGVGSGGGGGGGSSR